MPDNFVTNMLKGVLTNVCTSDNYSSLDLIHLSTIGLICTNHMNDLWEASIEYTMSGYKTF